MRIRNLKGMHEIVENHKIVVNEPEKNKGKWNEFFGNDNKLYVELGMGKGDFIIQNAEIYKDINFIGFEKFTNVLVRAVKKLDETQLTNVAMIRVDVETIQEIVEKKELDRIYLNFSDPWVKDKYTKRRLTYRKFLDIYESILADDGEIHFKTDNNDLFEFSLEEFKHCGWEIKLVTRDLHNSEYKEGNIMTEYEAKFVSLGENINKLIAKKPVR